MCIFDIFYQNVVEVLSDLEEHCFPIAIFVFSLYLGIFNLCEVSYIKLRKKINYEYVARKNKFHSVASYY